MHNGKNGTNNGNSRISGDARVAAPAANAQDGMAVKRRDGTQNTLSSFPGWFMDAGPEAQPLPVPVTPAEGHGAGLAEVFIQDVKDSLAAADRLGQERFWRQGLPASPEGPEDAGWPVRWRRPA